MDLTTLPEPTPSFDRFRKAILLEEEPDRVPFFEIQIDPEITASLLEEEVISQFDTDPEQIQKRLLQDIRLMHRLGYDYVLVWNMPIMLTNFLLTQDTADLSRGVRPWQGEGKGPISTREEFDRFPWPDVNKRRYTRFRFVEERLPQGMKILAPLPGPFETARALLGITSLAYLIYDDPSLVEDVFARVGEIITKAIRSISAIDGVGGVIVADDMGFKSDLMLSPDLLRQLVLPWHQKIGEAIHENGKLFILHACGKVEKLMDDLIKVAKIDARHSYEDQVTSIEEANRLYGAEIAVLGGVDMDLLARGSEEEVKARSRQIIDACSPGGGFALGSGNSVANYVPPQNFLAMLAEGRKQ